MNFFELSKELCEKGMTPDKAQEVKNLMITGPPNSERKAIWLALTGAAWIMQENPSYYQRLLTSKKGVETVATRQIDVDLNRTFATEKFFVNRKNVEKLRNVLVAYSFRNETIGYCQGMNFIVARLLGLGYYEEECFWILAQIMEKYMPFDYYTDMSGLIVDIRALDRLIRKYLPKVSSHFEQINIEPLLFSVQWFVCVFSYNLSSQCLMRVWDLFFCEGISYLFRVSLAVLYINRKKILSINNMNDALEYLGTVSNQIKNPDLLLETTERFQISLRDIEEIRKEFLVDTRFPENFSLYCNGENTCKALQKLTSDYFTFLSMNQVSFEEDYLDSCENKKNNAKLTLISQDDIVLAVKNHYCPKAVPKKKLNKLFESLNKVKIVMPRITLSPFFLQSSNEVLEVPNLS